MTKKVRVAVARGCYADMSDLLEEFGGRAELFEVDLGTSGEDISRAVGEAEILIVGLHPLRREHLEAISGRVKVVGRSGIGLDSIDLEAAREASVAVIHQPNYGSLEVATHAVSLILAVHRRLLESDRLARHGWGGRAGLGDIPALDEMSAGVVGVGRIGRAVVERIRPFVHRVVTFDPYAVDIPMDVQHVDSLEDLLDACGIVTLHLPLNDETRFMIAAAELERMSNDSILVNVSRGGLVDEIALARALQDGSIGGAGLDVLSEEPPPPDHPLLTAPNLIITPHTAWYSLASERRCKHWTVGDTLGYIEGQPLIGRLAVGPFEA